MYINQELGRYGENKACQYLLQNNYKIIERNFRCKFGEIDIIANDMSKSELVFIEVKTRSTFLFGKPAEAVNLVKQNHILKVANYYIYKNRIKNAFIRFDIIEIFVQGCQFQVNHIKQIL